MSNSDPSYDVKASKSSLVASCEFGRVRKIKSLKTRELRRLRLKAYKSVFLQEIIPLLTNRLPNDM